MADDITVTPYREFTLRAFANRTKGAELIPLLAQVMEAYRDLTPVERAAVAAWFSMTYGLTPKDQQ